jgi:hypothetical protein
MQWTRDLYDYEASPPPGSWERISFELDNNISALRKSLKEVEETPPTAVWSALQKELHGEEPAKVISIPWYAKISNWVAAAAITGILFMAYFLTNNRNDFKPSELATSIQSPESTSLAGKNKIPVDNTIVPPAPVRSASAGQKDSATNLQPQTILELSLPSASKSDHETHRPAMILAKIEADATPDGFSIPHRLDDNRDYNKMKSVQFDDGNYIHIVSSEGNTTRLSYKLQEMIPAIRNDVDNSRLNQWKSKLQSSAFIPASANFFDIADMVKMLSDQ